MRKFQIFLFIEACLLTGALIMMVSEHFSRFLLILLLFLLLIRYYTGRQGNNLILVAVSILFFFIIMLNPFVILAIFVALIYSLFLLYPMMNQEREDTNLVFEDVITVKRRKIVGLEIFITSQATRPVVLMILISFVLWGKILFIWSM